VKSVRGTSGPADVAVVSVDRGEGPPVVLLHGLAGSGRWWTRNLPALARSFRVIALDLPGFGATHRDARFILDRVPGQVLAAMDGLGIDRASVVGHSMGGLVAGGVAADHPDRVDRLVLVDAGFVSLDPSALGRVTGVIAAARWTSPTIYPVVIRDAFRSGPIRLARTTVQLLAADWTARLPRIVAPTLIIWGEHDTICRPRIGREMATRIPGSRLVVIGGAGHNPMWERATDFDREVVAFLTASDRAGPTAEPADS
jgi:pimeloyl-ACP methyl ester carboxylesterase